MGRISVVAGGMVTAVGFNYRSSCAAIRAGVRGVRQVNLWDAENAEYLSGAKVDLPQWWTGTGKLADLAAPAIWECLEAARPEEPEAIPILLGIADPDRPGRFERLDQEILDEIEFRCGLPHHPLSKVFPQGNVSAVIALSEARNILDSRSARCCVVAGVDSFIQQELIDAYIGARRIMTATNSNGFFPGEAGCAVLVRPSADASAELRILGIGFGQETATVGSTNPLLGIGQVEASRNALAEAGLKMHEVGFRNTDVNGEHYKFKEAILTQGRLLKERVERQDIWHAAECTGEIGAASAPCALAVQLYASRRAFSPPPRSLCHFSGDGPERAACVVEFAQGWTM